MVGELAGAGPNGRRASFEHIVADVTLVGFLGCLLVLVVYTVGRAAIYGQPHRITFGPDALYFDPPLTDREPVQQVSRSELGAIRLESQRVQPTVTIDRGVQRLDTWAWLPYQERAWLADVLRAWADRQDRDSPTTLCPPDGSWITVRSDAGVCRLSWQPPTNRLLYEWMRWNLVLAQCHVLIALLAAAVFLEIVCGRVLVQQLGGGRDWVLVGLFVLLALLTWHSLITLRNGVAGIRQLFAKTRPEFLTLNATSLTHDPGNFLLPGSQGYAIHTGAPQVIPLAEIDDVGLQPRRQLVAVVQGKEERIIGSCLRPPEREWLAQVLRSWAGKSESTSTARAPAEGGRHTMKEQRTSTSFGPEPGLPADGPAMTVLRG
jgi:hypothetical protein